VATHVGGDPAVVGQTVRLDSDPSTIIGVMPPEFRHPGHTLRSDVDVWACAGYIAPPFPTPPRRGIRLFPGAIGRIKPWLTVAKAQARLDAFVAELRRPYPREYPEAARWTVQLAPLHQEVVGNTGTMLFVLLAAVSVVLLIACVNIASLLLARSAVRHREIAVRQALGAGAGRLVRQVLTESVVLSVGGGILALVLTFSLKRLLLQFVPSALPRLQELGVNSHVLLFALGISLITGLSFGLAPALQLADRGLMDELRQGSRSGALGLRQRRFLSGLMISEFALSLVLLVRAGLPLRSFWEVLQVQPGFEASHLVMAHLWLSFPDDPNLNPYLKQARPLLRRTNLPTRLAVGAVA
jgi:predicted permease